MPMELQSAIRVLARRAGMSIVRQQCTSEQQLCNLVCLSYEQLQHHSNPPIFRFLTQNQKVKKRKNTVPICCIEVVGIH